MKKALVATILVLLLLIPVVSAAESKTKFGAGVTVGYPLEGIIGTYDITDKLDVQLSLGYSVGARGFLIGAGVNYNVYSFKLSERDYLDLTVGGDLGVGIPVGYGRLYGVSYKPYVLMLDITASVGISYTFANIPLDVFLRIPLGVRLNIPNKDWWEGTGRSGFNVGFAGGGQIGAVYNF